MWSRGVGPFKHIQTVRADALVCAIGAAICIPTLILAIQNIESNMNFAWVCKIWTMKHFKFAFF